MKTPDEIMNELAYCHGSESFFRTMNRRLFHTEGIKALCDLCESFWLIDIVASVINTKLKGDFYVFTMKKLENNEGKIIVDDGNDNIEYTQNIEYTDFPLNEYSFYVEKGSIDGINLSYIAMLKSER
jgi:hypothetical protein